MAKTIVIDTEVKGVDQALQDIDKIDNAVDGVNQKNISPKFDTAKTEKSLENLQKKGEQIEKVGQGIAGGFALATGVVGSFGSELGYSTEEIENAQAKASSFIGILVSIKPVVEGVGSGFKLLGSILKTNPLILLATIIGGIIVSFLDMGAIVDGIKKGFKVFGDAVSATFDFIVDAAMFAIDMYTQFLDVITFGLLDINGSYKSYTKSLEDASAAEKKREENAIKERALIVQNILELKKKIKILDEEIKIIEKTKASVIARYDQEIRLAQASGKETYAIEKQKLADIIDFTEKEIQLKLKKYLATKALQQEESNFTKNLMGEDMAFVLDNNQEEIKANNVKVRELAELRKQVNDAKDTDAVLDANRRKENSDAFKKSEEEKTATLEEEGEKRKELQRQLEDQIAANIKDADERAITQLQLKHQRERDALIEKYGKDSALLGNLERIQAGERNKLLDEIQEGDLEEKAKRDEKNLKDQKTSAGIILQAKTDADNAWKEKEDDKLKKKKETEEAIFNVAQAGINGLKSIGELAIKDQEKAQKFSALMTASQMALDSARAITGAVAATAGIPFPANIPAIATAVATVLGNIATAVKAFKQAKVGSAPSVSTPSTSGVGASSNASENEVVRRGANGETFTGDQPALTRPPMARVSVLNSELQMVRQEQEAIVEQSTL